MDARCRTLYNRIQAIDPEKFREMVAERAFLKAERRCFAPGCELQDWLEAEAEISNQYYYWYFEFD